VNDARLTSHGAEAFPAEIVTESVGIGSWQATLLVDCRSLSSCAMGEDTSTAVIIGVEVASFRVDALGLQVQIVLIDALASSTSFTNGAAVHVILL